MLVLALIGMIAFVILFVWAMLNMGTELLDFVSRLPIIRKIFEMSFGINVSGEVSFGILFSVCYTHAVVLSLAWSVIIATTTRVIVGEVERGTADLLFTLPVTRAEVFVSTTVVWVLSAAALSFAPMIGIVIANAIFQPDESVQISRFFLPAINFFFLNLAVGAFSTMMSCFLNRRGRVVGIVVGVVLCSVVLNFLEPFLSWVQSVKFLSLLSYFRPVDLVRTGQWPVQQVVVLFGIAVVSWTIGLLYFSKKDIPTSG